MDLPELVEYAESRCVMSDHLVNIGLPPFLPRFDHWAVSTESTSARASGSSSLI
jgi:hypothetical protein